jgi:hypothetical protein
MTRHNFCNTEEYVCLKDGLWNFNFADIRHIRLTLCPRCPFHSRRFERKKYITHRINIFFPLFSSPFSLTLLLSHLSANHCFILAFGLVISWKNGFAISQSIEQHCTHTESLQVTFLITNFCSYFLLCNPIGHFRFHFIHTKTTTTRAKQFC